MTSEIAILNQEAVALASDSAVTVYEGRKIYNSANKLFCLSKYAPVGIMIYGNATFMSTPFETIIKVFRENLSDTKYSNLEAYGKAFISFLDNNEIQISQEEQDKYLEFVTCVILNDIKEKIINECEQEIKKSGKIKYDKVNEITSIIVAGYKEDFSRHKMLTCFPPNFVSSFRKKLDSALVNCLGKNFQDFPLSESHKSDIAQILDLAITRDIFPPWFTGIVIAGFGERNIYPVIVSYNVEALINGKLKFKENKSKRIGVEVTSGIHTFAQSEMVTTFMTGVDPDYQDFKRGYLKNIFSKYPETIVDNLKELDGIGPEKREEVKNHLREISLSIYKEYVDEMQNFSRENHVDMITNVVSILPKDELAAMAESLVNLTSFKKHVSMSQETVGGPIDVAVISKGDGFIWIKRKHYFKPELNPNFFNNYLRSKGKNEKEKTGG